MTMEKQEITAALLPSYLDGTLDSHVMDMVRDRLEADPAFLRALHALQEQEKALLDLGSALREVAPSVDMHDAVMARARRLQVSADPLEAALSELGGALRVAAPRLELAEAVMKAIPSLPVVEKELAATGNEIRAHAPRVDVAEDVMDDMASGRCDTLVPFPAQKHNNNAPPRRESPFSWQFVVAAAACLLAVASVVVMQMARPPALRGVDIARRDTAASVAQRSRRIAETPRIREGEPLRFMPASSGDQRISLLSSAPRPAASQTPDAGDDKADEQQITPAIEDIIAAKRNVLSGQSEALALLARWGALDPDEIRRLLAEGLISSTELAGISRFLPDEDARTLLRLALEQSPDDHVLRYALARQLMDDPAYYGEALQEVGLLREMAPDNSLAYYMDAQIRFAQGNYAGALESLEYAASLQAASAYALETAQRHSAALQAAGLPADVAQLLAAFNAGTDEYASLTQLSADLLGYGAYFESIGDYDTALAIYKSVQHLGAQINAGADFTNEMLAGLDTQRASIEAINALAQIMEIPGGAFTVEIAYTVFLEGLDFFLEYTNIFEDIMGGSDSENMMHAVAQIMRMGEIQFFRAP